MLSIFVETSCNRYERDECVNCHVFEPLSPYDNKAPHLTPGQAKIMVDKIRQVEPLTALARQEINLTGGEASQNPRIVEVFKVFQTLTPNVCLHTNLDINSRESKRWQRLVEIIGLSGRVDITLYPVVWESSQKPFMKEMIQLQNRLLVNVIYESLQNLFSQIDLLGRFFKEQGKRFKHVTSLLDDYCGKIDILLKENSNCGENEFLRRMENTSAFAYSKEDSLTSEEFTFGINILPGFDVDKEGRRAMAYIPFPRDPYLLKCTAVRGEIETMTVREDGRMTPCCDVGNLLCQPDFGNLLKDTPEEILVKFEVSRQKMSSGVMKNSYNFQNGRMGEWVEEGIPPYCV